MKQEFSDFQLFLFILSAYGVLAEMSSCNVSVNDGFDIDSLR